VSGSPALAVLAPERPDLWQAALEGALRPEFLRSPLVIPAGSPLAPPECGVAGCPRAGTRIPWGVFETRLCHTHGVAWERAGRPAQDEWLLAQRPPMILEAIEPCVVVDCPRAAESVGLCYAHGDRWRRAGRPTLTQFARSARPAAVGDGVCRVPDCGFPACPARKSRVVLCDMHLRRFGNWKHLQGGGADRSLDGYIDALRERAERVAVVRLALPDAPLVELELRFALQHRHDRGEGFIRLPEWRKLVARVNELGVRSLLERDIEPWGEDTIRRGGVTHWLSYVRYAWETLFAFRARCGLDDPWAPDVWRLQALPLDQAAIVSRGGALDWRAIRPVWLRELCKRWARHRLRQGVSAGHVCGVRRAIVRLVEFCDLAGRPLDHSGCLTRELFDAFLDHVRGLDLSAQSRHLLAGGVKQLFEEAHDLGWISLRHPRVYLPGELPRGRDHLPRALPAAVVKRLNEPGALELLTASGRAAVLVLMDGGLRARDTARLRVDAVISGSDGAPYLRYFNHKRRREAVVPISERATEAIAVQRASVRERYPHCEWLFPRQKANGRAEQPMGYSFIWNTLRSWWEALDLRDEHGEPFRPSPHAFRHTYASGLVNKEVDLFSVQSLLDHDSPEMTWRYARMSKETLRRKWEQGQRRINIRGELVALDVDGELSDAAWAKEQIARAKQSLPNGWCALPLQQTCPHPNACLTCPTFLTDQTFLPQHREQLARTKQLIEHGKANGNERLVAINEATKVNLVAIIERAEELERQQREDTRGEEKNDAGG
jgi:integrase